MKKVAAAINGATGRPGDFAARYGREEFAVILPEADPHGEEHVAERIRKAVLSLEIPHESSLVEQWVTVSLGAATMLPGMNGSTEELILAADKALYKAKQEGRNRVAGSGNYCILP